MIDKEKAKLDPRKQWAKFIVVLVLYLLFLFWVKSWLGLIVVPFLFDVCISPKRYSGSGGAMPKVLHASSCRG